MFLLVLFTCNKIPLYCINLQREGTLSASAISNKMPIKRVTSYQAGIKYLEEA